jgi:hypothetical protein
MAMIIELVVRNKAASSLERTKNEQNEQSRTALRHEGPTSLSFWASLMMHGTG